MGKWSDTSENVLRQLQIVRVEHTYVISSQKNVKIRTFRSYQIVQVQHTCVLSSQKNLKNRIFGSYLFKKFPT
jgi:hypothetical protein